MSDDIVNKINIYMNNVLEELNNLGVQQDEAEKIMYETGFTFNVYEFPDMYLNFSIKEIARSIIASYEKK